MLILPITTRRLKSGDDLAAILHATGMIEAGDIVVISSKAVATVEGSSIDLRSKKPVNRAEELAKICHQNPLFTQAILDETERLNGDVIGTCPWTLLTSLKPKGMKSGRILCPNAGLDQSNVEKGYAIGWPVEPVESVRRLRKELETVGRIPKKPGSPKNPTNSRYSSVSSESSDASGSFRIAIILTDSCCHPTRAGVVAFALTCAGIDPVRSEAGNRDLFGRPLQFTTEAVADQLATAANAVMGNAAQATPAAIIRDHGIAFSDFCGWVEGIEEKDDLFEELFKPIHMKGKKVKRNEGKK
ncbi:MAG: coenzyme F420-0:L-glutamate ligase [Candidatus Peribacteraceae bacterium]|nr:coenzyme F420-0:L-glutamate ligase [Candidatus Peribacteraceae bacterium]